MSAVLEATPAGTQAAMIEAALNATHPRLALPTIASHFNVTLADLQAVLNHHGYPEAMRLRQAAKALRGQAVEEADTAHDTSPAPTTPADDKPRMVRVAVADRLIVVAGHRRLTAIKRLRWTHVDVIVRAPMKPDHVVAAMLIENGQRRDLDPIEEARGITRLKVEHGLTDGNVARKIGRSQSYVSGRLALLALTPEQQEQIRAGALGLTHATDLARLQSGKTRHSDKGHVTVAYFGPTNDLATRAHARCSRLGHRNKISGGTACGSCWESVIRADERSHLQDVNAIADDCVTCGHPIDHTPQGATS